MRSFAFVLIGLSMLGAFAAAGSAPAAGRADGLRDVIVMFHDRGVPPERSDVPGAVEESLRRLADESQSRFLREFVGRARDARPFWLINAVALRVSDEVAAAMAAHPDVRRVVDSKRFRVPLPSPAGRRSAERAGEGPWTWGLAKLRVPEARAEWGVYGDGAVVGVIDTGVYAGHRDLQGKVVAFRDFVEGATEPYDDRGHGTHCCGTVAGGDRSGCAVGVAPRATLVVAKALDNMGYADTSDLLAAMQWMADPDGDPATADGPSVVSNSWGGRGDEEPLQAAVRAWVALGITPVFAAGNSGPAAGSVLTPAGLPESVAVGATDEGDRVTEFSGRGPFKWQGTTLVKPDVSAPGEGIYSTYVGGGYEVESGTSMACPHVAGVVALLHGACGRLSPARTRELLEAAVVDLGPPGKDNAYGFGRLDVPTLLARAVTGGRLLGRLVGPDGEPAAGTVTVLGLGLELPAATGTGRFVATLPPGPYQLSVRAFGYRDVGPLAVALGPSGDTPLEVRLERAAGAVVSGRAVDGASGAPLAATVRVLGTPLPPLEAPEGAFRLELPSGTYRLLVSSFGYAPWRSGPVTASASAAVEVVAPLHALPPVLLVDDDRGKDYERWFHAALDAGGLAHDTATMVELGDLPLADLLGYDAVVWFTGRDSYTSLTDRDQEVLQGYLARGGGLVLTGENLGFDLQGSAFLRDVLKCKVLNDGTPSRKVAGQGLSFAIEGGDGANNQFYPDLLQALPGAEVYLQYQAPAGTAAVRVAAGAGRCVFLGFGLEAVATADARAELMRRALTAVTPTPAGKVLRVLDLEREAWRTRWAELVAPLAATLPPAEARLVAGRLRASGEGGAARRLLQSLNAR